MLALLILYSEQQYGNVAVLLLLMLLVLLNSEVNYRTSIVLEEKIIKERLELFSRTKLMLTKFAICV